ncbi:MAG: hypothetical protein AABW67_04205 [Nanoarchaeota archaeon]
MIKKHKKKSLKFYWIILSILFIILIIFIVNQKKCDSLGCIDKNGCYISIHKENTNKKIYDSVHCLESKGYYWDNCEQICMKIDYNTMPDNYTLCNTSFYESYFKAININEISENITTYHFCNEFIIGNNEICNESEYWEYDSFINKCATLKFK